MHPLVHVGMASFNGARFIERTYEDWLAQSYPHWQMTISDNGSSDGSREIIAKRFDDPRVRYVFNEQNIGAYRNFEKLRSYAGTAKYFCWSSDHDRRTSDFLEQSVAIMESDERVILVGSQSWPRDADGKPLDRLDEDTDTRHCGSAIERVRYMLRHLGWNHCIYGVWRNRMLSNPLRIPDVFGGDYLVTLLNAIQGAYAYIREPLLFPIRNRPEALDRDSIPRIAAMSFLPELSTMDHIVNAAISIATVAKHIAPDGSLDQDVRDFVQRRWSLNLSESG